MATLVTMTEQDIVTHELPRYRCHKEVWALNIAAIDTTEIDGRLCGRLIPTDSSYAPIPISTDYLTKHQPAVGGYYVVDADGYTSYSPAEPFESDYTRI